MSAVTPSQEREKLLAIAQALAAAMGSAEVTLPSGMLVVDAASVQALRRTLNDWLQLYPVGKTPRPIK